MWTYHKAQNQILKNIKCTCDMPVIVVVRIHSFLHPDTTDLERPMTK